MRVLSTAGIVPYKQSPGNRVVSDAPVWGTPSDDAVA
jgi:hypothetical protein